MVKGRKVQENCYSVKQRELGGILILEIMKKREKQEKKETIALEGWLKATKPHFAYLSNLILFFF